MDICCYIVDTALIKQLTNGISTMLSIGKMNKLTIDRIVNMGAYLKSEEGEVLLPNKYLTENVRAGDAINVFVYRESENRLMATTTRPHAEVGDIAILPVADVNDSIGAFLDWGMEKDLLLPFRRQLRPVSPGQKCVVKIMIDEHTGRVIASSRLRQLLQLNDGTLNAGMEVTALFFDESENGLSAAVNNTYLAMLNKLDATERIHIGESRTAYIKRVLPDGHIYLSLRKVGHEAVVEARPQLLEALEKAGGFLPFTDKSSPEEIWTNFQLSKKAFKRVVGSLYKKKKILLKDDGIHLVPPKQP